MLILVNLCAHAPPQEESVLALEYIGCLDIAIVLKSYMPDASSAPQHHQLSSTYWL
jgi:hypothetical protein